MKNYREVDFAGNRLDKVVEFLLSAKEKGNLICVEFNGVMLYSDTVTMDNAYIVVTGMTKKESDDAFNKFIEDSEKEKLEYQRRVPELIEKWVKEGKKVLTEDKWKEWEETVPIRLNDLYRGMELKYCLDLVKKLNEGTFEESKIMIESQNHSGLSYSLICSMIKEFSPKGKDFVEYLNKNKGLTSI